MDFVLGEMSALMTEGLSCRNQKRKKTPGRSGRALFAYGLELDDGDRSVGVWPIASTRHR